MNLRNEVENDKEKATQSTEGNHKTNYGSQPLTDSISLQNIIERNCSPFLPDTPSRDEADSETPKSNRLAKSWRIRLSKSNDQRIEKQGSRKTSVEIFEKIKPFIEILSRDKNSSGKVYVLASCKVCNNRSGRIDRVRQHLIRDHPEVLNQKTETELKPLASVKSDSDS